MVELFQNWTEEEPLNTLKVNSPFLKWDEAVASLKLGRRFHVKQRLSILSLSAATAAFSTSPLPDLLLVLPAANLVGDLLSTCVCSSWSVSWL